MRLSPDPRATRAGQLRQTSPQREKSISSNQLLNYCHVLG